MLLAAHYANAINDRTMASGEHASSSSVLTRPPAASRSIASICGGAEPVVTLVGTPPEVGIAERFPFLYRLVRLGCLPVLKQLFDLRVSGDQHLPVSGPFILAANHHNYLDGVVLGVALSRPIAFLVMPRVFNASPLHPALHRRIGSIPLNLERPDPGAIKRVLRVLEGGRIVGIFPEGPFSQEGRLVPGQPGAAMIALRSGVPVVPAAIAGTYEALRGRRFHLPRRHPLSVRFGTPIRVGEVRQRPVTRAEREDLTRRIMKDIADLLEVERGSAPRAAGRAGAW
jgi:1-acyl-sn-glycerol-3-phosphate acyltransferase